MDLKVKLNRLGKDVNKRFPYLNHGGCCVYAAMVVAELRKQKVPAVGIVASYGAEEGVSIDLARQAVQNNTLREWNDNGISFSHVGVEFDHNGVKKHYDSNGVHKVRKVLDHMPIYEGRLQYKELKELAERVEGWNPSFDRNIIPELRKIVKSYISGNGAETRMARNVKAKSVLRRRWEIACNYISPFHF